MGSTTRYPGLCTVPDPALDAASPSDALPARTGSRLRRETVYDEVRRRILLGEFPTRSRLVEERVAAVLGVSRTPVREALVRLAADRLLQRHEDGGYQVVEPDLRGLRDLYELRITLELRGLARGLEPGVRHDVSVLEPLRDHWRRLDGDLPRPSPTFVEVDESFHVALSRAGGNAALTETLETVNARIRPVRMYDFLTEDRIAATVTQHLGIVEAVLAGHLPQALELLQSHVGASLDVVERRAERAITQMALRRSGS